MAGRWKGRKRGRSYCWTGLPLKERVTHCIYAFQPLPAHFSLLFSLSSPSLLSFLFTLSLSVSFSLHPALLFCLLTIFSLSPYRISYCFFTLSVFPPSSSSSSAVTWFPSVDSTVTRFLTCHRSCCAFRFISGEWQVRRFYHSLSYLTRPPGVHSFVTPRYKGGEG